MPPPSANGIRLPGYIARPPSPFAGFPSCTAPAPLTPWRLPLGTHRESASQPPMYNPPPSRTRAAQAAMSSSTPDKTSDSHSHTFDFHDPGRPIGSGQYGDVVSVKCLGCSEVCPRRSGFPPSPPPPRTETRTPSDRDAPPCPIRSPRQATVTPRLTRVLTIVFCAEAHQQKVGAALLG